MNLLRNRPLATVCVAFLGALALAANTDGITKLCLGVAAVFFLFLPLLPRLRRRTSLLIPICAAAVLLALLYGYIRFDRYFDMADAYAGEEVTVSAVVNEITYENEHTLALTVTCEEINGKTASERISVWAYTSIHPARGNRITFTAVLSPVSGEDSIAMYLRAKGIAAQAEDVFDLSIADATRDAGLLTGLFSNLRAALGTRLTDCIPSRGGFLLRALLLGEQELLSDTLVRDFRRTGLSHVLSLSGLHLSLLVGAITLLFRRMHWSRRIGILSQALLVLFYMALTGFSLSITRAGLMTLVFSISFFARRRADSMTSLSVAATAIALVSPNAMYDCGYWLSVVATFGILVHNEWQKGQPTPPPIHCWGRLWRAAKNALGITFAATLATLPLVAFFFGEFSLITPLSNLLLLPFFNICLFLAIFALPLGGIPFVAGLLGVFTELSLLLVEAFSSLRGIVISISEPWIQLLLVALGIAILLGLTIPRVRRRQLALITTCGLALVILVSGAGWLYRATQHGVYYGYAGSNEMLLVQDGNAGLLCDFSNGSYTAQRNGLSAIKHAHLTELEGYLITHYHARHAKSLPRLLGQIYIRTLYLPTPRSAEEEQLYRQLTAIAEEQGIACIRYEAYEEFTFGNTWSLQPHALGKSDSAHPAVAISLRRGERMLTYLGAGYHESDRRESAASAVAKSDALFFGLHGGKENSLPSFPSYSSALTTVILPCDRSISPGLASFLGNRVLIAEEEQFVWIP